MLRFVDCLACALDRDSLSERHVSLVPPLRAKKISLLCVCAHTAHFVGEFVDNPDGLVVVRPLNESDKPLREPCQKDEVSFCDHPLRCVEGCRSASCFGGSRIVPLQTLERAGTRTTATEQDPGAWTQNGVRFLPRYRAKGRCKRDGQEIPYHVSVDEGESGLPIFRCKADGVDGNREGFSGEGPMPSSAMRCFFAALGVTVSHHLSALKFFSFNRPPVRRAIDQALEKPVEDSAPGPSTSSSPADSIIPLVLPGRARK